MSLALKLNDEIQRMSQYPHSFLSTLDQTSLQSLLFFEAKSFFCRSFYRVNHKKLELYRYANIGSGVRELHSDFVNIDFFYSKLALKEFFGIEEKHKNGFVQADLRFSLPFPKNRFEGIFSEHALEHLYPNEAFNLLCEIHRVLAPGGVFRITLPDFQKSASDYINNSLNSDPWSVDFRSKGEQINKVMKWGHKALYDAEFLIYLLKVIGFVDVRETTFREGLNPDLLIDKEIRKPCTFYVEAVKASSTHG